MPLDLPVIKTIDVTGDKGVVKEILREGTGNETPPAKSKVTVHYDGYLENGTKFDSSRDRGEHYIAPLGIGRVIKAWDAGISTFKKGELSRLICKPEYAYGDASPEGSTIPKNATLIFEVEVFDWDDADPETIVERITGAGKKKTQGNDFFKQEKWKQAQEKYELAMSYIEDKKSLWGINEEQQKQVIELKATLHLNLAATLLKLGDPYEAAAQCTKSLEVDKTNVKALFRRGQSYNKAGEFDLARKDLIEAAKLEPSNKAIRDEIDAVKKNEQISREKEKQMFGVMIDRAKRPPIPAQQPTTSTQDQPTQTQTQQ